MLSHLARKLSILVLVLFLVLGGSAFACPAASQESSSEKTAAQEKSGETSNAPEKDKGEELEAGFRHSSSVKLIAKIMGLKVSDDIPKEERDKNLDKAYWVSVILNFVVLFLILFIPLRKVLPKFFKGRTESIQKRLEESRKTTEDARRRLTEVESRLSRLDAEIAQMRNAADADAQAEEQRALAAVEEERHRIVQSAEQEIAMAANAARRELKAFAADLAVDLAEKKIQSRKLADEALVHDFAAQLGKDGR